MDLAVFFFSHTTLTDIVHCDP